MLVCLKFLPAISHFSHLLCHSWRQVPDNNITSLFAVTATLWLVNGVCSKVRLYYHNRVK